MGHRGTRTRVRRHRSTVRLPVAVFNASYANDLPYSRRQRLAVEHWGANNRERSTIRDTSPFLWLDVQVVLPQTSSLLDKGSLLIPHAPVPTYSGPRRSAVRFVELLEAPPSLVGSPAWLGPWERVSRPVETDMFSVAAPAADQLWGVIPAVPPVDLAVR